jgi:DNA-binding XRE family transcriptional regulator
MSIEDIRSSYSGPQLKEKREAALLTQEELGNKIGVTKQTIIAWEKEITTPSLKHLRALKEFFAQKTPSN